MATHKIKGVVITTTYVFPPIPIRSFDWSAVAEGYEEQSPIGYGKTEQAAIADFQLVLYHQLLLAEIAEYE